ncbi:MAG TPA: TIGR02452 family protein [Eggerthellaceae bacterium]|nr:TIGR02452 family protein [Eggerthellaceae bacterium]
MPTRDERQIEAKKHLGLVKGVFAKEIAETVESAVLYEDGEGRDLALPEPRFETTEIRVERTEAAQAVYKAKGKACVLDFASYRNPGGGYANGGWAQEEALCAESNLQPILEGLRDVYYTPNRQTMRGGLYSDRALYLKDVMFTIDGGMKKRDVIVSAAVNRRFALENNRSEVECDIDMGNRVRSVLHIAAANEVDTLVLGAFGCGVFGNDPNKVALLFKNWLDANPGQFETVVFAVPSGPNHDVFAEVFPRKEEPVQPEVSVAEDDEFDDDVDDWFYNTDENSGRWIFE